MRAAVLEEFGEPLVVQEVELAEPRPGEVLVRLEACGVCHTDLYTASGADPTGYAPCVLGHEGAGVVERVGEGVTLVQPGDHVVTLFAPECGECIHCRSPRTNRCIAIRDKQGRATCPTAPRACTATASRCATSWARRPSPSTPSCPRSRWPRSARRRRSTAARLFACGLSTGLGAAMYTAEVQPGSVVAVFGCGLVGLGAVAGARIQGAERIIAVDLADNRLKMAVDHGATDTMKAGADVVDRIRDMTGGYGADYTFEATGNVDVMRQAVEAAREAGAWHDDRRRRQGRDCWTSSRASSSPAAASRARRSAASRAAPRCRCSSTAGWRATIDVPSLVSHHITLDEVNHGFELMEHQDGIRSVITFCMIIERTEHPGWLSNAYLVADRPGGHGVLIDGNGVVEPLLERIERDGITITHILNTHHHGDHVVDNDRYKRASASPLVAHPLTAREVPGVDETHRGRRGARERRAHDPRASSRPATPPGTSASSSTAPTSSPPTCSSRARSAARARPAHTTFADLRARSWIAS